MQESLKGELDACWEHNPWYLYQYAPPAGFRTIDELYSLIDEGVYKGKSDIYMTKAMNVLSQLFGLLMTGNFRSFKTNDYSD